MRVDPTGNAWWHWVIGGVMVVAGIVACFIPGGQVVGVNIMEMEIVIYYLILLAVSIFFGIVSVMELGWLNHELLCINDNLKRIEIKSEFIKKLFPYKDVFHASIYKTDYQITKIVFFLELYYYVLVFLNVLCAIIIVILNLFSFEGRILSLVAIIPTVITFVSFLLCYFIKYTLPLLIKGPKKK